MTVGELFAYVDDIKPNAFTAEQKMIWLNELEARIQKDVLLRWRGEWEQYRWPEDKDVSPLLDPPDDAMYRHWLEAMIDYANGEYDKYQNTAALFNQVWNSFVARFATRYRPADGYDRRWEGGGFRT